MSTKKQLEGNSVEEQTCGIKKIYPDAKIIVENCSGAKERPLFNQILQFIKTDDYMVVTKLDRFCRSAKEGLGYIDFLMNKGVKIHILNMGLIENTPMGRLILTNLLAFAEFERSMIVERTQSGKTIAKKRAGFKDGRPPKFTDEQIRHALYLLNNHTYSEVESMMGISKSTLIRAKRNQNEWKVHQFNLTSTDGKTD